MNGQTGRRADGQRTTFQQQVLWKKAQEFAVAAAETLDGLSGGPAAGIIGNQFLRSATSIPANIAEGYGRYSEAAYRNHLSIARGSLFETESWIDLLALAGYITPKARDRLIAACEEVARLVTATMKPLKSARNPSVRDEESEYVIDGDV